MGLTIKTPSEDYLTGITLIDLSDERIDRIADYAGEAAINATAEVKVVGRDLTDDDNCLLLATVGVALLLVAAERMETDPDALYASLMEKLECGEFGETQD